MERKYQRVRLVTRPKQKQKLLASLALVMKNIRNAEALQEPLSTIVQAVKSALEQSPPELAADINDDGVVDAADVLLLQQRIGEQ